MSTSTSKQPFRPGFDLPLAPFLCQPDLPFSDVFTTTHVEQAFHRHEVSFGSAHNTILTPALALWAFLSQAVFSDRSCAAACVRISVLLLAFSRPCWSEDTGCYCRARCRLGSLVLQDLALGLAERLEAACPEHWRWKKHRTFLADGSTLTLADTPENQAAYPQPSSQKKGLGFPRTRLVALLSLATGMVNGLANGPYQGKKTGELALVVSLLGRLSKGDVLVADSYYCAFVLLALLQQRGIHALVRLHGSRKCDFRKGQRLGHKDHLVKYKKPRRPEWLSEELYQTLPEELTVRELDVSLSEPGRKSERVVLVTTLLDTEAYTKEELAELYKLRWLVEVDLRGLKQTLGIDHLEEKTPEMAMAQLWARVLSYNLTRKVMTQAAQQEKVKPRELSLNGALQQLREYWQTLSGPEKEKREEAGRRVLKGVGRQRVGRQPGRQEPRAVKRRPENRPILRVSREEAKKRLAKGGKQARSVSKRRHR